MAFNLRDDFGIVFMTAHDPAPGSSGWGDGTDTFGSRFATAFRCGDERALGRQRRTRHRRRRRRRRRRCSKIGPFFPTKHPFSSRLVRGNSLRSVGV